MNNCINCDEEFEGTYCNHCGQKAKIGRITFHYIWHGILHFFTHAEKGFLFTSGQMLIAPGRTVKNFIDGKRRKYQPPVSYFLIWAGIYIVLLSGIDKWWGINEVINFGEYFGSEEGSKFFLRSFNFTGIFALIIPSFYLYIVITRGMYNYFESLVAMVFALGTVAFLQVIFIISAVLIYFIVGSSIHFQLSDPLRVLYLAWFIFDFVKLLPLKGKIIRSVTVFFLMFATFTILKLYVFPWLTGSFR